MKYASVCSGVEAASLAWNVMGWEPVWFSEIDKFPSKVLEHRFPNVPNLGDMTKITMEKNENGQIYHGENGQSVFVENGIDLLVGGTPCFAAGEMVLSEKGYVPIENIKIGDMVVSHKGRLCPVTAVGHKTADIGELKIVGRNPIRCTDYHPFYSFAVKKDNSGKSSAYSNMVKYGEWNFVKAKEIPGRFVGRISDSTGDDTTAPEITDVIACLSGWYAGDGCIKHEKNEKIIVISDLSEQKMEKFKSRFFGNIKFEVCRGGEVRIYDTGLSDWLVENFGELPFQKRIPLWLYKSPYKDDFIDGYTNAKGYHRKDGSIRFNTVSGELAYGIADLLRTASVSMTKVHPTKVIHGRTVKQHDYYSVTWNEKSKIIKYEEDRYATRGQWYKAGAAGTVYNITVDGDHSYIVNGIAVHNCQGFSVAGKQGGLDDERSGLALCYVEMLRAFQPKWFVWENVPGVFSTNEGNDIKQFFHAIDELGYSVAWRVLDAQYVRVDGYPGAVPQRRRRIIAVGHLGEDWRYPAKVLFDTEGVHGDTPPSRKERKRTSKNIGGCSAETGTRIGFAMSSFAGYKKGDCGTLKANGGDVGGGSENLILYSNGISSKTTRPHNENEIPVFKDTGVANTLNTFDSGEKRANEFVIHEEIDFEKGKAFQQNTRDEIRYINGDGNIAGALAAELGAKQQNYVHILKNVDKIECKKDDSDCNDKKMTSFSVGNGQVAEATIMLKECSQTLNCMHDVGAVLQVMTPNGEDIATPLDVSYYKGAGSRAGEERMFVYDTRGNENNNNEKIVLDDQGGKVMNIHHDISPTLRAETHNHLPSVMCLDMQGSKGMCRVEKDDCSPTIMRMHGSDMHCVCVPQKVYSIDSVSSNSMKSSNPNSGFHESDISKTLDTNPPSPECNQGGQVIVAPIDIRDAVRDPDKMDTGLNRQGTGVGEIDAPANTLSCGPVPGVIQCEQSSYAIAENIIGRKEQNGGNGSGFQKELAYTQNATGVMGVCAGFTGRAGAESDICYSESTAPTIRESMTLDTLQSSSVRRLTPLECERLMGFPDNWTRIPVKIHSEKPNGKRFVDFNDLFEEIEEGKYIEYAPDGPRYKACGNSMCVNVMRWVGRRIEKVENEGVEGYGKEFE